MPETDQPQEPTKQVPEPATRPYDIILTEKEQQLAELQHKLAALPDGSSDRYKLEEQISNIKKDIAVYSSPQHDFSQD